MDNLIRLVETLNQSTAPVQNVILLILFTLAIFAMVVVWQILSCFVMIAQGFRNRLSKAVIVSKRQEVQSSKQPIVADVEAQTMTMGKE